MGKLELISKAVDRFLAKSYVHNYPLESFRETEQYLDFEQALYDGILKQASFVAANLADAPEFPEEPNDVRVMLWESAMQLWLQTYMPKMGLLLDYDMIYALLHDAFVYNCKAQTRAQGVIVKSRTADRLYKASVDATQIVFELTNLFYIEALKNDAAYLLNTKSKGYDQTTKDRLVKLVRDGRLDRQTIDEVAKLIEEQFSSISSVRSFMIANTETANAFGQANLAFMKENDVPTKSWVGAGPHTCKFCLQNVVAGEIPVDQVFPTGVFHVPGHVNCECYEEAGEIDLSKVDIWHGQ